MTFVHERRAKIYLLQLDVAIGFVVFVRLLVKD